MPPIKLAADLDLPLALDASAARPLHRQLAEQVRQAILDGRLGSGARLPSTRALAQALGVSRTVTSSAYATLFAEGYLDGRQGSGTYVGGDLPTKSPLRRTVANPSPRWLNHDAIGGTSEPSTSTTIAFHLGTPSLVSLSSRAWRSAWRTVIDCRPPDTYDPRNGDANLRQELARYLGRSRGLACAPEDIVITAGAGHALDLIARVLVAGNATVAFEDPGYPAARYILQSRGACIAPIPLDDDGMQIERLPNGAAAPIMVYTTPSHQYPLATRMPIARRLALLAWAQRNDSLIIEDDYDSEFRYGASPLPALASLDIAGHVAYIGTFSKVLTPSLRIGYLVVPPALRERIMRLLRQTGESASWPVQQMLATFIADGHLERHIRRMRQHYALKRQALADTLASIAPLAQLRGLEAGLHAYLELRDNLDATQIARHVQELGVQVTMLGAYYLGKPDRSGLLLGFGNLEIADIIRGATILKQVIEQTQEYEGHITAK